MRSFLVRNKQPIIKWGSLPDGTMLKGKVPFGWDLAVVPGPEYIILDVDRHGDKDGFDHIPKNILNELNKTFHYKTKNNGVHYWLKYSGSVYLPNKSSGLGIDLRTDKGYVIFYLRENLDSYLSEIKTTSLELNKWLEETFYYVNKNKNGKKEIATLGC